MGTIKRLALEKRAMTPHILTRALLPSSDKPTRDEASSKSALRLIDDIKENICWDSNNGSEMAVLGQGRHLGIDMEWRLQWRPDGAFFMEVRGAQLAYSWGYDGGGKDTSGWRAAPWHWSLDRSSAEASEEPQGFVWEADHTGVAQALELDDWEATLLCTWIKTGHWLHPEAQSLLDITLAPPVDATTADVQDVLQLQLTGGKVRAELTLSADKRWPVSVRLLVYGDEETWDLQSWQPLLNDRLFPSSIINCPAAGGKHTYMVTSSRVGPQQPVLFNLPTSATSGGVAPGVTFEEPRSKVPMQWVRSGHILVWPLVNSRQIGPFILDTGASGMVMTPAAAEELDLPAFGELWVAGVGGAVRSQFRQGESLTLGGMEMDAPLFMEMKLDGIVNGAEMPVAGIIGYDLLRHATLEVPARSQSLTDTSPFLYVAHPSRGACGAGGGGGGVGEEEEEEWWVPLRFVANVPHVAARFPRFGKLEEGQTAAEEEELFMLDSGAGGAQCIFHGRAVSRLELLESLPDSAGYARVRGVSDAEKGVGQSSGLRARTAQLDWLQLVGGHRFEDVKTMLPTDGGFDLSEHTCGMLCGDLLSTCGIIYDYPRRRICIQPVSPS
ncbi:hypothetical protein CYMTET_40386 [Cymbomonas tetramitiformis]|uniref:Peptidase A2 domain-containing protein n=1 Tax=Cymbomonas tetramitiformis TaxID=36881 RepID=A0AAE0C882_9CHLO|nr:hypothetical protein CYMTET_40386 [Cymbomonas tetramitiformis]